MKNVLVAIARSESAKEKYTKQLQGQIDNALYWGWSVSDVVVLANFPFNYCEVEAVDLLVPSYARTNVKSYGIRHLLLETSLVDEDEQVWLHDLDAWQLDAFNKEEIETFKDLAICDCRKYVNGGIFFYRNTPFARSFVEDLVLTMDKASQRKEEPTITRLLRDEKYRDNVTYITAQYNFGEKQPSIKRRDALRNGIYVIHNVEKQFSYILESEQMLAIYRRYGPIVFDLKTAVDVVAMQLTATRELRKRIGKLERANRKLERANRKLRQSVEQRDRKLQISEADHE